MLNALINYWINLVINVIFSVLKQTPNSGVQAL